MTDDTAAIQAAIGPGTGVTCFPTGTYLVSAELKVWSEYGGALVIGDHSGRRPVLLLKAGSPGFDDPANPGYVVRFYEHGEPKPRTAWVDTFGSQLDGIDITMEADNPGAIGIFHAGAQNSYIRNCNITMNGNLAGIAWLPGDSVNENICITGGQVGIRMSEGQWPVTLRGCTFRDQAVAAIEAYQCGFVLQGCLFEGCRTGVRVPWGEGYPYPAARLFFRDCVFRDIRGGAALTGTSASRFDWLLAMRNVYLEGVPHIIHWADAPPASMPGQPAGWCRVVDVSHGARWQDGVRVAADGGDFRLVDEDVPAPDFTPDRYVDPIPTRAQCVDVRAAFGARGDGVHDDTEAIRRAIAGSTTPIWFPMGVYRVADTIRLRRDTRLVGEHCRLTEIRLVPAPGHGSFDDRGQPKPLIDTADEPGGSAILAHFCLGLYADDPATPAVEFDGLIGVRWRVGGQSVLDDLFIHNVAYGGQRQTGYAALVLSGHGGGHVRNVWAPWVNCSGPGQLVVQDLQGPLDLFGLSVEHCTARPAVHIANARHVTFWQLQSEGAAIVVDAHDSEHLTFHSVHYNQDLVLPVAMRFANCAEVELNCYWRNWNKTFSDAVHFERPGKVAVTPESGLAVYRWR